MSKSASIYTRVDPELKEQVEKVLVKLGLPMANAINLYLNQIVMHNGIPFDLKLPNNAPLDYSSMTKTQYNQEMGKGLADLTNGQVTTSSQVRENMKRKYMA